MSYDISLEAELKHAGWIDVGECHNITYNLADMFRALTGSTPKGWDGMPANELAPLLDSALRKLDEHPEEYEQYEAPNGWGTIAGCKAFIEQLHDDCMAYPFATIREES